MATRAGPPGAIPRPASTKPNTPALGAFADDGGSLRSKLRTPIRAPPPGGGPLPPAAAAAAGPGCVRIRIPGFPLHGAGSSFGRAAGDRRAGAGAACSAAHGRFCGFSITPAANPSASAGRPLSWPPRILRRGEFCFAARRPSRPGRHPRERAVPPLDDPGPARTARARQGLDSAPAIHEFLSSSSGEPRRRADTQSSHRHRDEPQASCGAQETRRLERPPQSGAEQPPPSGAEQPPQSSASERLPAAPKVRGCRCLACRQRGQPGPPPVPPHWSARRAPPPPSQEPSPRSMRRVAGAVPARLRRYGAADPARHCDLEKCRHNRPISSQRNSPCNPTSQLPAAKAVRVQLDASKEQPYLH